MTPSQLTHISPSGNPRMVDVGNKAITTRTAVAEATIVVGPKIGAMLNESGSVAKGNVMDTARIAGIMAAKKTHELIPMCHALALDCVDVEFSLGSERVIVRATAKCSGTTGVEMEAMTAASVAALTVYDMCKSADKGILVESLRLLEKSGGKSGTWNAEQSLGKDVS